MSIQFIPDESALPTSGAGAGYVRSLCDKTIYIAGSSGECYAKQDGTEWEHAGWDMRDDVDGKKRLRQPATCYGDSGHTPKPIPAKRRS